MAMTTTRFTNNVMRAKAVKKTAPKFGGSKAAKTNTGQSSGGKAHTIGGKAGNQYGGSKPANMAPKG